MLFLDYMQLKRIKGAVFLSLLLTVSSGIYSASFNFTYSQRQLLPVGHWVYDAIYRLYTECGMCNLTDTAPISVGELRLYFSRLQYEKLSKAGQELYIRTYDFLYNESANWKKAKFKFSSAFMALNGFASPELLFKSNSALDWSWLTSYCGQKNGSCFKFNTTLADNDYKLYLEDVARHEAAGGYDKNSTQYKEDQKDKRRVYDSEGNIRYKLDKKYLTEEEDCYKTHKDKGEYGYIGGYNGSALNKALLELPLMLGFGNIFMIETDFILAKNYWGSTEDYNFVNLPLSSEDVEFYMPRTAYASIGYTFNKWGFDVNVGRTGLQIGHSLTGSVIYNDSFDTQFYFQLNFYCQYMKYNLDVTQIEKNKFLYLHEVDVTPWKWLKIGIIEGTLINEPFELRFLDPLMIMHSFGSWTDYSNDKEEEIYGESHVCAYLAAFLDIVPCRNFRIYALYAQNEMQAAYELGSASSRAIPDGFGWQAGIDLDLPYKKGGYFKVGLEGIYTTPFLYIKQGKDWSLFSQRHDMQTKGSTPLYSWVGTPFGPDACGFEALFNYEYKDKWKAEIVYLFLAHGTNSFGLFNSYYIDKDGEKFSAYYPSVLRHIGIYTDEESKNRARDYKLTGTVQFTNNITIRGYYRFNKHLRLNAQGSFILVLNNGNRAGADEAGVELTTYLEYNVF